MSILEDFDKIGMALNELEEERDLLPTEEFPAFSDKLSDLAEEFCKLRDGETALTEKEVIQRLQRVKEKVKRLGKPFDIDPDDIEEEEEDIYWEDLEIRDAFHKINDALINLDGEPDFVSCAIELQELVKQEAMLPEEKVKKRLRLLEKKLRKLGIEL